MNVVESRDSQVGKECRGDESCEGCNDLNNNDDDVS